MHFFSSRSSSPGCGGEDDAEGGRTVVAAFYPLAWAAEQLAGDAIEVVNLTPPGAEPHDLELSARDVERVREADVVFYLGQGFMPALEDALGEHPHAVDLLEGELLRDPHVWLDPMKLAAIAEKIAAELGDPAAANDLVARLEDLDGELARGLADCDRQEIVTSHAAFGYLAAAYGLRQIALTGISPEGEPSPRALEQLVEEVEEVGCDDGLLRDARLARAGGDGRARGGSRDRGARSARGPVGGAISRPAPTTCPSCATTSRRSGGRSDAASRRARRGSRSGIAPANGCSRKSGSRSERASSSQSRARTAAARRRSCGSCSVSSGRRAGRALLYGEPAHRFSRRRTLGYLAQRSEIGGDAPTTVRELVSAGRLAAGGLIGPLRRRDRELTAEAIARVGLADVADAPLRTLSGGMQQRAFIAKALAGEPSLLVLDEPTTGVDAESQESLAGLLDRLHSELGVTILYVSHEFGAVERFVERLVLVRRTIVFDGPPSALPGVWHDPSHVHA